MARYRKIDVRLWGDARFNRLTAPPPNARYLWFYLLTNPDTVSLPGLYRAGEAAMAEALGWPLKGFREAFAEAFAEGLVQADWIARVVWVPNVIKYNLPESPNVVRSWRIPWDEIPECDLKHQAFQHLRPVVEALGEAFAKAFREAFGEGYRKGYGESGAGAGAGAGTRTGAGQEGGVGETKAPAPAAPPPPLGGAELEKANGERALPSAITVDQLVKVYHAFCPRLPKIRTLTAKRRRQYATRLHEHPDPEWWAEVFERVEGSAFLRGDAGRNGAGWSGATLDWLTVNTDHAVKVIEGQYDRSQDGSGGGRR